MEKSPTYSPTYLLTYTNRYSSATATRDSTSTTLSLSPSKFCPGAYVRTCGGRDVEGEPFPGGPIPITSIVRPASAYFDKSIRSTFCVSVARFSHLNSRLNRVANTYLLTYLLDHSRLPSSSRHR